MSEGVVIALIGILSVPITIFVTWFVNRRRNIADVYSAMYGPAVGASQDAVETMATVVTELREQVTALRVENAELRGQIKSLRHQIEILELNLVTEQRIQTDIESSLDGVKPVKEQKPTQGEQLSLDGVG